MLTLDHLRDLRAEELRRLLPFPGQAKTVLEIGAGTGEQAKKLADLDYHVEAIEYSNSSFDVLAKNRVWDVSDYDGRNIPFDENSFDVVFSSNVMEHIPHVEEFQAEIRRVLRPGGVAIHLMPTTGWRFWTIVTHWIHVIQRQATRVLGSKNTWLPVQAAASSVNDRRRNLGQKVWWNLCPPRHGEIGNAFGELYYFSSGRWTSLFENTGWEIVHVRPSGLFYTGYSVLDSKLRLSRRIRLASVFGSACNVYVLK